MYKNDKVGPLSCSSVDLADVHVIVGVSTATTDPTHRHPCLRTDWTQETLVHLWYRHSRPHLLREGQLRRRGTRLVCHCRACQGGGKGWGDSDEYRYSRVRFSRQSYAPRTPDTLRCDPHPHLNEHFVWIGIGTRSWRQLQHRNVAFSPHSLLSSLERTALVLLHLHLDCTLPPFNNRTSSTTKLVRSGRTRSPRPAQLGRERARTRRGRCWTRASCRSAPGATAAGSELQWDEQWRRGRDR